MMRALWTGASGMTSQQMNVDVIANNLANVNTIGFKGERLEFKSLLYQTLQMADLDPINEMGTRPVNLQVGLGVRPVATSRDFMQGGIEVTNNPLNVAIQGPGFFSIQGRGEVVYTRDGAFILSAYGDELILTTHNGDFVLDTSHNTISIPGNVAVTDIIIDRDFNISIRRPDEDIDEHIAQIEVVQFPNPQGLQAIGNNHFIPSVASGPPLLEASDDLTVFSQAVQGARELSNVQVAVEMVRLIVAQRAYEVNARIITTSDDMLQQANNLRRM